MVTPWGNSSWTSDGKNNWTNTVSLSPDQQAALNSQMQIQANQSSLAQQLQGQVAGTMANGFTAPSMGSYMSGVGPVDKDFSSFNPSQVSAIETNAPKFSDATAQETAKAAYEASTGLLKDQWTQDSTNLDAQLRLQGLTPGSEAYNNAMQNQMRVQAQQQDQLADQAVLTGSNIANQNYASSLAGYNAGNAAQNQQFSQALAGYGANQTAQQNANAAQAQQYGQALQSYQTDYQTAYQNYLQPLNSMNAVLTGQQVSQPSFSGAPNTTAGYVPGTDYSGAASALGQYNSGIAAQNAANSSSTMGLVGSAAMAAAVYF